MPCRSQKSIEHIQLVSNLQPAVLLPLSPAVPEPAHSIFFTVSFSRPACLHNSLLAILSG